MNGIITLTTDFGTQDGYVGAMKGVLLREHPAARLVDLTHDVPPQDVFAGAFALAQAACFFPPGTVHIAVVDPGVGSSRRALIVEHDGALFVAPDNGLTWLAAPGAAWAIDSTRLPPEWLIHPTFHGRDLFARIAARLAAGAPIAEFSTGIVVQRQLALPPAAREGATLRGEVIHIDRFGNLVTSFPGGTVSGTLTVAGVDAPLHTTYADVAPGQPVAYLGSSGFIEVAVRDGSAATLLSASRGAVVRSHKE
ncbi:MAG: hypothetical protein EXR72_21100 [Myxococcales bacterium]|nr:hypothetical protein [Myxococcales bacterium]